MRKEGNFNGYIPKPFFVPLACLGWHNCTNIPKDFLPSLFLLALFPWRCFEGQRHRFIVIDHLCLKCHTSWVSLLCVVVSCSFLPPAGPGPTQEELRRRVENGVKEFWYFVRSEVKKLANAEPSERQKYADTLLQDLGHQERWACRHLERQGKGHRWKCQNAVASQRECQSTLWGGGSSV